MVIQWLFCPRIAIRPYILKLKLKWNLSSESRISRRWRHQLLRWAWKAIIWLFFSWNLPCCMKIKEIGLPGGVPGGPLDPPMLSYFENTCLMIHIEPLLHYLRRSDRLFKVFKHWFPCQPHVRCAIFVQSFTCFLDDIQNSSGFLLLNSSHE